MVCDLRVQNVMRSHCLSPQRGVHGENTNCFVARQGNKLIDDRELAPLKELIDKITR